jgi:hypothetical protein
LSSHAGQLVLEGRQIGEKHAEVIGSPALQQGLACLVHHRQHAVGEMQIDSCVE